jgi:hypothetical protein
MSQGLAQPLRRAMRDCAAFFAASSFVLDKHLFSNPG